MILNIYHGALGNYAGCFEGLTTEGKKHRLKKNKMKPLIITNLH